MRRRFTLGALLACASPLAAQEASVVIGGSHARYADSLDGTAGLVGGRVAFGELSRVAQLEAAFSRFTLGGWALQLGGQGTALWSVARSPIHLGLAAGASLNHVEGGTTTGTGALGPMLAVRVARMQITAGSSAGAFRSLDGGWSAIGNASLRGYWTPGPGAALDVGGVVTLADTLRFADFAVHAAIARGPLSVGVVGGTRVGDLEEQLWGSVDAALELGRRLVFEASAGRYPRDVTGFTEGVYGQVAIRVFALRRPARVRLPPVAVDVRRTDERHVRVSLRYHEDVTSLEIAGDWSGWIPISLTPEGDGRWVAELEAAPGAYAYALRADGRWVVPDGVTGVDDGFGGVVARLIVPR